MTCHMITWWPPNFFLFRSCRQLWAANDFENDKKKESERFQRCESANHLNDWQSVKQRLINFRFNGSLTLAHTKCFFHTRNFSRLTKCSFHAHVCPHIVAHKILSYTNFCTIFFVYENDSRLCFGLINSKSVFVWLRWFSCSQGKNLEDLVC